MSADVKEERMADGGMRIWFRGNKHPLLGLSMRASDEQTPLVFEEYKSVSGDGVAIG